MKLTHRLFVLASVALLPAIGLQIYNEIALRRAHEAAVRDAAMRNARQAASELDRVLESGRTLLMAMAKVPSIRALDTPGCVGYLAALQPEAPHLLSIAAIDLSGRVRCRQQLPADELRFSDRSYFKDAIRTGEFVVGEFTSGRVAGRPVLPLALPLRGDDGEIIGVLAVALDLRWLTARFRERGLPPGGSVTIADRNGVIIAREPFPDQFIGTRIPGQHLNLVKAPHPDAIEIVSQDGTRRVLGYMPVEPARGAYVSVGLSAEQSFAAVEASSRRGLLAVLAGAAIALVAAWAFGRAFIEKPVRHVLDTVEMWERGDFRARTSLHHLEGELGRLGYAFNGVVEKLAARERALRESEGRFRELADSAPVLIWMLGPDKSGMYFNKPWLVFTGRKLEEELGEGWLDGVHPKDMPALEACADAFAMRRPFTTEFRMRRHDGEWRWFLDSGVPRFDEHGEFLGFIGCSIDITERKQAEERQALLVNELNHRVKNTLATVQSLATHTLRTAATPEQFREAFEARLLALSETHNLLTQRNWAGASLTHLIEHEVAPYAEKHGSKRLVVRGEDIELQPRAALALGMAFHELATNAAKYGALSNGTGCIEVSWQAANGCPPKDSIQLTWTEREGPLVRPPAQRGFGSRLVDRSIRVELGGRVDADFDPAGLRVSIEIPRRHAVQPAEPAAAAQPGPLLRDSPDPVRAESDHPT
jgi:PAS domain S-box-containing protein